MKVTFLNVGQGDSIVIEWLLDGIERYGLIDCKKRRSNNSVPAIDFIEANRIQVLEFIILTHPHSDHFSGFQNLFYYLEKNNITVKNFYHTAILDPNRIRTVVNGKQYKKEIARLFSIIDDMEEKGLIESGFMTETGAEFPLNDEWKFRILSPSIKEFNAFTKAVNLKIIVDQDEDFENETFANYLSSVIVFYTDSSYFLLTSDALDLSFPRLDKKNKSFFGTRKFLFGQIAHHGSIKNFVREFWKIKASTTDNPIALISVGENTYGHPSEEVLQMLTDLNYIVKTTNDSAAASPISSDTDMLLDVLAEEEESEGQDITLKIEDGNVYFVD